MTLIRNNYLLLLIFLLGLVLRIYNLGAESVWYDEAISIAVAKLELIAQYKWNFAQNDNTPGLYYVILRFWIRMFGDSEFAARFSSVLFGSFSIMAMYGVGRSLFNKNVGLIAALILATSVFHIKYSQETRSYALLAFFTLLSYYFYLKITSSKQKPYFVAYIISSILLLYLHYFGLLIIAAQNIFFFTNYFTNRKTGELGLKRWVVSQIVLFLLYVPGLVLLIKHFLAIQSGFWIPEPNLLEFYKLFLLYSGSLNLFVLFLVFSLLTIICLRQIKDKIGLKGALRPTADYSEKLSLQDSDRLYLLLLWLFVPIVLPFLVSLVSTPILVSRYTIGASLAFYLLVARGIDSIGNRKIIFLIAGLILALSYLNIERYYRSVDKYQWRETISYIEDNASIGDYVTVYPLFEIDTAHYYKDRDDLHYYALNDELISITDIGNKNLWLVIADHARTKRKALEDAMQQRYDLLDQKKYKSLNLYKYQKKQVQ